jgi:hypothetical protein
MNVTQGFIALGGIFSLLIYHGLSNAVSSFRRWRESRQAARK